MSVSSGSDITIPIQDSPPPPPSPYANSKRPSKDASSQSQSTNKKGTHNSKTPEPRGDVAGVDNVAYQPSETNKSHNKNEKEASQNSNVTSININGFKNDKKDPSSGIQETSVNDEIINMNVLDTIPHKPQPEFGPYENFDQYFIPVNQHKKILRGEKLYVTKDKRKSSQCGKYICWFLGALLLTAIVTIAILAGVGLFPPKNSQEVSSLVGLTSTTSFPDQFTSSSEASSSFAPSDLDFTIFTTTESSTSATSSPPVSDIYVPYTADVQLALSNAEYEDALADPSSEAYRTLARSVEAELKNSMETEGNLGPTNVRVVEFSTGSVIVKLRVSWMDRSVDMSRVQRFLASLHTLGEYEIRSGTTSYAVLNNCKMGNNGCSDFCTFDYEAVDFYCTCPEELILGTDNKTCHPAETSSEAPSSSNATETSPAHEPEFETSSDGSHSEEPTQPTTEVTEGTVSVSSEFTPASSSGNETASSGTELQPPSSEEPELDHSASLETVSSTPAPAAEGTTTQATEHHEPVEPSSNDVSSAVPVLTDDEVPETTTATPQSQEFDNASLLNDTSSSPDFDYNTDAEILTPEVTMQHNHDKDKLVLIETTTTSGQEASPNDGTSEESQTAQPHIEVSENQTIILEPGNENVTSEAQIQEDQQVLELTTASSGSGSDDSISTLAPEIQVPLTTVQPSHIIAEEVSVEDHNPSYSNSSESIVDLITPNVSNVESSAVVSTDDNEDHVDEMSTESVTPVEVIQHETNTNEQRNSSRTRALLKDQDQVQDVSNSQEEDLGPEQILSVTTTETEDPSTTTLRPSLPPVHSDEFMAFSDANMSEINSILVTPKTGQTTEVPVEGTHSIESMTSYEVQDGDANTSTGIDASVSSSIEQTPQEQDHHHQVVSSEEVDPAQVVPVPETTTIKPISLMNDTDVNNSEGVTEDLVNAEYLTTKPASAEVEAITEDSQQAVAGPEQVSEGQAQNHERQSQDSVEPQPPTPSASEDDTLQRTEVPPTAPDSAEHQHDPESEVPSVDVDTLVLAFSPTTSTGPTTTFSTNSPHVNISINEWGRTVAEFIANPTSVNHGTPIAELSSTTADAAAQREPVVSGPEYQDPELPTIYSTTIDIIRTNLTTTPVPVPSNPYNYITNTFSELVNSDPMTAATTTHSPADTSTKSHELPPAEQNNPQASPAPAPQQEGDDNKANNENDTDSGNELI